MSPKKEEQHELAHKETLNALNTNYPQAQDEYSSSVYTPVNPLAEQIAATKPEEQKRVSFTGDSRLRRLPSRSSSASSQRADQAVQKNMETFSLDLVGEWANGMAFKEGFCWLAFVKPEFRAETANRVGRWPNPLNWAKDKDEWKRVGELDKEMGLWPTYDEDGRRSQFRSHLAEVDYAPVKVTLMELVLYPVEMATLAGCNGHFWEIGGLPEVDSAYPTPPDTPVGEDPEEIARILETTEKGAMVHHVSWDAEKSRFWGLAKSRLPGSCFAELFPHDRESMTARELRNLLKGRFMALKAENPPNMLAWRFLILEQLNGVWHVGEPCFKQVTSSHIPLANAINKITLAAKANPASLDWEVALTTCMILGTIGDVQPTVEAALVTAAEARLKGIEPGDWRLQSTEGLRPLHKAALEIWSPSLSVAWERAGGEKNGCVLSLLEPLMCPFVTSGNEICVDVLLPGVNLSKPDDKSCWKRVVPGDWILVSAGSPQLIIPDDLVVVTHPEHQKFVETKYPGAQFRPVPVPVHEFIELGQSLMKISEIFNVGPGLTKLNSWIEGAFTEFVKLAEQSDLLFVVSGAVSAPYLGSLYPGKKIFEVCPVPRSDTSDAPEFYLMCLFGEMELPPSLSREMAKALEITMAAKLSRRLGVEVGRAPPPKIQCAPGWVLDLYDVTGLAVPFKPFSVFTRKWELAGSVSSREFDVPGGKPNVAYIPGPCGCGWRSGSGCVCSPGRVTLEWPSGVSRLHSDPLGRKRAYFSMGSCESLGKKTLEWVDAIINSDLELVVDKRWAHLFVGREIEEAPYREHSSWLGEFDLVIHHGGAGVVYTCCQLGNWQMVLPEVGDQIEWKRVVKRLGFLVEDLGPDALWRKVTSPGCCPLGVGDAPPLTSGARVWTLHPPHCYPEVPRLPLLKCYDLAIKGGINFDGLWTHVYWQATRSTPPYLESRFSPAYLSEVWDDLVLNFSSDGDDQLQRVVKAVLVETGLVRKRDILRNAPKMGLITGAVSLAAFGRDYVNLLKSWGRHIVDFTNAAGLGEPQVVPDSGLVEHINYSSYIPTFAKFPRLTRDIRETMALREKVLQSHPADRNMYIWLRPLFGRLPGITFGFMHAVVEVGGKWYELQRVRNGVNLIVRHDTPQAAFANLEWAKVVSVPIRLGWQPKMKELSGIFDGNKYRSLGDNCLFFANYMVLRATGRIVPWKHFGAYGAKIPLSFGEFFSEWVAGHWRGVKGDQKVELAKFVQEGALAKFMDRQRIPGIYGDWERSKEQNYGKECYESVAQFLASGAVQTILGANSTGDALYSQVSLALSKFTLSGKVIHRAMSYAAARSLNWTSEEAHLLIVIGARLEVGLHNPLTDQVRGALVTTRRWWGVKPRRKVVWAPLISFHTPHHWLYNGDVGAFTSTIHASDRLKLTGGQRVVKLNVRSILERYRHQFPEVDFPNVRMTRVHQGEWTLETKVPIRRAEPGLPKDFERVVRELRELTGAEAGVFSLRYATGEMAEEVTNRYFTGVDTGFTTPEYRQALADAIVEASPEKYSNVKLLAPEDAMHKWHVKYSAGFPYRFNEKGNAKRADLIRACGGREEFLKAVRAYIEQPEKFPSISHAFIKDEVLPESYIERRKIRTVIAQDILSYFTAMAVEGDLNKRMNPFDTSSLGISPQHGGMSQQAAEHVPFRHHYANDITALDSRMCWDYLDVVCRVRKRGFDNHPQRKAIHELIDVAAENLYASWIVDIHSGRARFKEQGGSTGHASTTPTNTIYVEALYLDAWTGVTGRPMKEFYEQCKLNTYADDNYWSTSLPRDVWGPELVQDYLAKHGVHLRLEAASDSIDGISFLAKWFSTKPEDIEHAKEVTGVAPPVCVIHDKGRLVMKFSDCKGRADLRTRWSKTVSLLDNCAHHPDIHAVGWKYLHEVLEPKMRKRPLTRTWMKQTKPHTYQEVMEMMYTDKFHQDPFKWHGNSPATDIHLFFEGLRQDIIAWDGSVTHVSRLLERWTGLAHTFGLSSETEGADVSDFSRAHLDQEFILERHLYVHAGMPSDVTSLQRLARQSPFSEFLRIEEFWKRRDHWIHSKSDLPMLNLGIGILYLVYTFVCWLDHNAARIPIIGPIYRFMTSLEAASGEVYANLNAFYFGMFGCSSASLSGLVPRDKKNFQKHMAIQLFGKFTHLLPDIQGPDLDSFKEVADQWIGLVAMGHALSFRGDFWLLAPVKEEPTKTELSSAGAWEALDHSDSVERCIEIIRKGRVPVITSSTGAGKSTDFISCLSRKFKTVYLSMPRKILVSTNPVVNQRVYSGSQDKLMEGKINGVTHGYLALALTEMEPDSILVLDEFHELDENSLRLLERFQGQVICMSATPPSYRPESFESVTLSKSRSSAWRVEEVIHKKWSTVENHAMLRIQENLGSKTAVIIPSYRKCEQLRNQVEKTLPAVRCQVVSRTNMEVDPNMDLYICTSVVDSGITFPGLEVVVDSGLSVGRKRGKFGTFDSSKATSEQRRGRTGRTCNGKYIRLNHKFDDEKFDYSTAFATGKGLLARDFGERRNLPLYDEVVPFLSGFYGEFPLSGDHSSTVFWYCLAEEHGDVAKAKEKYKTIRKNPLGGDWGYLMDAYGNPPLTELKATIKKLENWEKDGGNWINEETGLIEKLDLAQDEPALVQLQQTRIFGRGTKIRGQCFEETGEWHARDQYTGARMQTAW
uniref:Polyprotein n=1 Tax=Annulohypoxylon moriforme hypovirus 1 TaxID=3081087 RepID=A0AA97BK71_9VIRU|nr:polyprotein [Annulohypoxylon moriforme hypovirus 1]